MLDVPSITFLANYLQGYPSTVLVVSHDRAFLNEVATDIIHQHSERLDYYRGANFGKHDKILKILSDTHILQNPSTPPRRSAARLPSANTRSRWARELTCKVCRSQMSYKD
jgi:hypothetical protein